MHNETKIRAVVCVMIAVFIASFSTMVFLELTTSQKALNFTFIVVLAFAILALDGHLREVVAKNEAIAKQKELNAFFVERKEAEEKEKIKNNELSSWILEQINKEAPEYAHKNNNVVDLKEARIRLAKKSNNRN